MPKDDVFVSVDVEADGPIPGDYSMLSLGAVVAAPSAPHTHHALDDAREQAEIFLRVKECAEGRGS